MTNFPALRNVPVFEILPGKYKNQKNKTKREPPFFQALWSQQFV